MKKEEMLGDLALLQIFFQRHVVLRMVIWALFFTILTHKVVMISFSKQKHILTLQSPVESAILR